MKPFVVAVTAAGAISLATVLTGCASSTPISVSSQSTPVTPGTPTTGAVVKVGASDKGRTVTVHQGQRVALVLTGGYWQVQGSSAPAVVRQDGGSSYLSPSPAGCAPGVGCRPQETDFTALTVGTAKLTASRTSCGEARRCTGDQGSYAVTINVTAG
ncbi:hypothetical protein ABIA32_003447 [Streptacidiphilus sp. MAP12-20]|uniref:hypothetical protein n=1 Tax=Streptacidiphilus sp. MAP12-20 TaxID=3156299 RepID=UPI00351890DB